MSKNRNSLNSLLEMASLAIWGVIGLLFLMVWLYG